MFLEKLMIPPDDKILATINEELNEDSERFAHNLNLFEEWADSQPHIPKDYDKVVLAKYLRISKQNMTKAKQKFEMLFVVRKTIPELFVFNFKPEDMKYTDNFSFWHSPNLTPDGYRVVLLSLKSPDPDCFDNDRNMRAFCNLSTFKLSYEPISAGDIFVVDCKHVTAIHTAKIFTSLFRKGMYFVQVGLALRVKQIIIINAPSYFEKVVKIVKLLLTEKLGNKILVDSGMELQKKLIPSYCIPVEYGGDNENMEEYEQMWRDCLQTYKEWLQSEHNKTALGDIHKNLNIVDFENELGVEGSFRKLAVD